MTTPAVYQVPNLPETFAMSVLDDAMAPKLPKGLRAHFSTTRKLLAGRTVLVQLDDGKAYIREFCPRETGDGWLARPKNPTYAAFDSRTQNLTIVGVYSGFDCPPGVDWPFIEAIDSTP